MKNILIPLKYRRGILWNSILAAAWITISLIFPMITLSENQTLYIFSSISQVVAGIYGLTLAGYVFLSNQQDRLVDRDDSLLEVVSRIQSGQHRMVIFITLLSVSAVFLALLVIAIREIDIGHLKSIILNVSVCLFISSILWTAYFVADVTRPDKISVESQSMKEEISSHTPSQQQLDNIGDEEGAEADVPPAASPAANHNFLAEFIGTFNRIEQLLETYAETNLASSAIVLNPTMIQLSPYGGVNKKSGMRWTITRVVKALVAEKILDKNFADELLEIIKYRNALVHGQDLSVEKNMLTRVENAFNRLRALLG